MEKKLRTLGPFFGFKKLGENYLTGRIKSEKEEAFNTTISNEIGKSNLNGKKFAEEMFEIKNILEKIWTRFEENEIEKEKELKWKYAAAVMDKIFFYLMIIFMCVTFVSIIMSIPNFYKGT